MTIDNTVNTISVQMNEKVRNDIIKTFSEIGPGKVRTVAQLYGKSNGIYGSLNEYKQEVERLVYESEMNKEDLGNQSNIYAKTGAGEIYRINNNVQESENAFFEEEITFAW